MMIMNVDRTPLSDTPKRRRVHSLPLPEFPVWPLARSLPCPAHRRVTGSTCFGIYAPPARPALNLETRYRHHTRPCIKHLPPGSRRPKKAAAHLPATARWGRETAPGGQMASHRTLGQSVPCRRSFSHCRAPGRSSQQLKCLIGAPRISLTQFRTFSKRCCKARCGWYSLLRQATCSPPTRTWESLNWSQRVTCTAPGSRTPKMEIDGTSLLAAAEAVLALDGGTGLGQAGCQPRRSPGLLGFLPHHVLTHKHGDDR